ncbi:MAG: NAD(P)H-hydrate dehydratase [Chloroflexi bacterium]|nr:NAD(P)H-hydrate dehydratase [Chloroflexota bacterium]
MKIVTAAQMREMERRFQKEGGSLDDLMERAGLAVAQGVRSEMREAVGKRVLVLVGPGNNGGDGLVAARHLRKWGGNVQAFLLASRPNEDPKLAQAQEAGVEVISEEASLSSLNGSLSEASLALDALLGTGHARLLEGRMREALLLVAQARSARSGLKVVALDLPSGLDADTGAVDPSALKADLTITLGCPKMGLFRFPGAGLVGRLEIADIGLPAHLGQDVETELITASLVRELLPPRPLEAHKGTFGRVLVVAGSINYIGAATLACSGAARVGAGLVTLATPQSLIPILASKLTEVTFLPLPETVPGVPASQASSVLSERLGDYQALLLGPGLGQHPATKEFILSALDSLPQGMPLVLDADALNILAGTSQWWRRLKGRAILTPHPGEMARLLGRSVAEVQADRLEAARRGAASWGQTVALKGAYTVIAEPGGKALLSPWANPALASAGTGDVLAGAMVGLLAQGLAPEAAAAASVYLHGRAGEMASREMGDAGVLASDLLPRLPRAIREVREG